MRPVLLSMAVVLTAALLSVRLSAAPPLAPGDRVVIVGNTFAERMHLFGYFETFLHCRFPDHDLIVRNLGWSGDEVALMPRPEGFGDLDAQLSREKADVVFACFGMNESFRGEAGLATFHRELDAFVRRLRGTRYNGSAPPRVILVSPIAQDRPRPELRDTEKRNAILRRYTDVIAKVASERGVDCIDLFSPTERRSSEASARRLTFNGIHLTEYGDWFVSREMARALDWLEGAPSPVSGSANSAEKLRRLVYEKNYQFFHWWRAPNLYYVHGGRRKNKGAIGLADERLAQLRLLGSLDREIHDFSKPSPASVWLREPEDGRPVWHPTPSTRAIPSLRRDDQPATPLPGFGRAARGPTEAPELTLESLRVPKGYRVNLFASEVRFPIANPIAIEFDARGRLWIANSPTWPHPLPGEQPTDSILIVEDSDGDGVADKHEVFLDRLNMIHGFTLADGGVYVSQAPNLVFARDTDGDDRADWLRIVLHGFGTEDVEHAMSKFRWGPGGSLYFTQGIFYNTQVETPHGPVRVRDGAVFRYRPRDDRLGVYVSHHFWNPYGTVFDDWGRGIVVDASAGHYYPMEPLSANFVYPKPKSRTNHLSFSHGSSIAAGCAFVRNRHFPPDVQNRFVVNHCVGDLGTRWFDVQPSGAGFRSTPRQPSLLEGKSPVFRPIAMAFGPDGALYVVDFYSYVFENVHYEKRHPGRDHSHGRIWRISCENRPLLEAPRIEGAGVDRLVDLLGAYENTTRELARRELRTRNRAVVLDSLKRWLSRMESRDAGYERELVEALWLAQSIGNIDRELLLRVLGARDARARAAGIRVLRFWQSRIEGASKLLRKLVNDPDPRVRLEAVLACGFSRAQDAQEIALEAAEHDLDPALRHALEDTLRYFEQSQR